MNALVHTWLIDTFFYTSVLIALVLLLRKPVARQFGPQVAYALWALPFLRLVMPPIVLPASMAPVETGAVIAPVTVMVSDIPQSAVTNTAAAVARPEVGIALADLLLPLWLGGALVFLALRTRDYVRMRRELLAEARPVGEVGKIRLVETPAVNAPLAFGIFDRVIALPTAFMAVHDRTARDMAIAHEIAHHRGHDLLANIAAQPLLALHWFNPLAWWGWRAMRKDQEAACDARVVAGQGKSERAAYAQVIAGFAAGDDYVLASPMSSALSCPMLGEKSIIHRLKSLTMSEVPSRRRRLGIAAVTTTALALPLTASFAYAEADAPESRAGAAVQAEAKAAQGPSGPFAAASAEDTAATEPYVIEEIDPSRMEDEQVALDLDRQADRQIIVDIDRAEDGERRLIRRVVRLDGMMNARERAALELEIEADIAEARAEMHEAIEESRVERAEALAEAREARREAMAEAREAQRQAMRAGEHVVQFACEDGDATSQTDRKDGQTVTRICHAQIMAGAREGLLKARAEVARNGQIPAATRDRILRELDEAISQMATDDRKSASWHGKSLRPARGTPRAIAISAHGYRAPAALVPAVTLLFDARSVPAVPAAPDCPEAPEPVRFSAQSA